MHTINALRHFVRRVRSGLAPKRLNSSRPGRFVLRACVIARHPFEYWLRRREARRLASAAAPVFIDPAAGFSRFTMADFDVLPRVVEVARTI